MVGPLGSALDCGRHYARTATCGAAPWEADPALRYGAVGGCAYPREWRRYFLARASARLAVHARCSSLRMPERRARPTSRRDTMFGFTKSLSIKVQVLAAFSIVFVATAALGIVAQDRLGAVNTEAADVRDNWLPSAGADGFLIEALANYRQRQLRITTVPADGIDAVVKQLD